MKKYLVITLFLFVFGYANAKWNDGIGDIVAQGTGAFLGGLVTGLVTKNPAATAAGIVVGEGAGQTAWNYTYDNWIPETWKFAIDYFK